MRTLKAPSLRTHQAPGLFINSFNKKNPLVLNIQALNNLPAHIPVLSKTHNQVLNDLLNEIKPVNFRDYLGLEEHEVLKTKHFIVAIITNLLVIAKQKKWNLCITYDYIYLYNGEFWQQCERSVIKNFLGRVAINMGCAKHEAKWVDFKKKLLEQFISDAQLPPPPKSLNEVLINLQNGTFEFTDKGCSLRGFNPNDFMIYQLPFAYDANAVCPLFDKYLLEVLPDTESRLVLQEFAGYIFTNLNLEKMLVLYGNGRNGKSVFFNILIALIGLNNVSNFPLGAYNGEYNRANLLNILLNYSSEKGTDLNVETFKALISGEPVQARHPYGRSFTIRNKVRFIMNANELPKETELTTAYFERYLIIPFDTYINEASRDPELAGKIIANELAGVFNWLLVGLNRLMSQKKFTACKRADITLIDFKKQSDSVALFIDEFNYIPSTTKKLALTDLYTKYKDFCRDDNYRPCGKNRFSARFKAKGFSPTRLNNGSASFFAETPPLPKKLNII